MPKSDSIKERMTRFGSGESILTMSKIVTKRTTLRRLCLSDLEALIELESDPDIMKFTPMAIPQTVEQTQKRLTEKIESQPSLEPLGFWAAELNGDQDFVGWFAYSKINSMDQRLDLWFEKSTGGWG